MSQSENLNPLGPFVRAIVQEVIAELREDPLDNGQPRGCSLWRVLRSISHALRLLSAICSAPKNSRRSGSMAGSISTFRNSTA